MIDLTGRVALVTGAGSGIGRAAALMLAHAGARVGLVEFRPERAAAVAGELAERGYEAETIVADVSQSKQMEAAVRQVADRWGGLDVVVANAGISPDSPVLEMDEQTWDRVIGVDLDGVFYTVRAAIPRLLDSKHARIICTASHYGVIGREGLAHYSAAKGGIIGLVRTMAVELGPRGITVNAVAPGPIQTRIVERTLEQVQTWEARLPLRRLGQPEDVAGAILFLASDLSSWITGHVLQVNGGAFTQ